MKTSPIVPADIDFSGDAPRAPAFDDVYASRAGALAQARHVFLGGNGLPQRWAARHRFVVLETGFGLGNNFLATWDAWRHDAQRCAQLVFIAVEKHPPRRVDLARAHANSPLAPLADELAAAWPPLTHNLHALDFDEGRVRLLLALGDVAAWLPEIVARVDAVYLDGFAPARNPDMWDPRLFKAIGRMAAPGATAATWSVARSVRDGLCAAGFVVERAPGFASKGEMSVARYAPAFTPRQAPARLPAAAPRTALVLGAGLAGAWAAHALAAEGVACAVVDRHGDAGSETSGNPAGLFHGIVTPEDGAHARFNRAAALHAARVLPPLLHAGVPGSIAGLLRLEPGGSRDAMLGTLARLGLPEDYVQALTAAEASQRAGVALASPAWFYARGGWLSPAALARRLLEGVARLPPCTVQALRGHEGRWQALDPQGRCIAEADAVVLANAADALRLLDHPPWPLHRVRGQLSVLHTRDPLPRLPLAGTGYAIPLADGRLVCGATSQPNDEHPFERESDHAENLAQLARLLGRAPQVDGPLHGRVGWRLVADDRLPVLGPVPAESLSDARLDQPRFIPRRLGLYTLTALGSRGITWAPLAARVLAAWMVGAPLPIEASLLDAVDCARFASRAARRPV